MRQQGRLTEWDPAQGLGVIAPLNGEAPLSVHVSEFPQELRRPIALDLVTYEVAHDAQGRPWATHVQHLTPTRASAPVAPPKASTSPASKRFVILGVAGLLLVACVLGSVSWASSRAETPSAAPVATAASDDVFAAAFRDRRTALPVAGEGVVSQVLTDDNKGSRHQRFILRLPSGQTLLVAHNIDIAPRLLGIKVGDTVAFGGVYEWNSQGGVVHWTHRDPSGGHAAGWLKLDGQMVQ
jgi:cold shock CspA family protein